MTDRKTAESSGDTAQRHSGNEPEAADKQTVAALASIIADECGLDAAQQETVAEAVDWLLEFGYLGGIDITLNQNGGLVRKRIEQP